jgi:uncharacterized membrane protein YoaK (UPF0700 family)
MLHHHPLAHRARVWQNRRVLSAPEAAMNPASAYRAALALALAATLFLAWMIPALGVIGVEGDPADLMYLGVFAVGIVGTLLARLRPIGMARTLMAMALATVVIALIALLLGRHQSPVTSVAELLGLNAMFIALFVGAALLFQHAARQRPPAPG